MKEPEERGELYLAFARALDRPTDFQPQRRPAPRPAGRTSPESAERHSNRDLAPRSLRDLRRIHSPIEGARGGRTRDWAARNGNGVARHAAAVCRGLSVRRSPARGARSSPVHGASMLCAAPRRSGFRAPLAQYRKRPRLLSRLRARYTRRRSRKPGSSGRARSPCRSRAERRSSSARGRTGSISCNRAARGSSTTRAERRRRPRTSKRVFRRN